MVCIQAHQSHTFGCFGRSPGAYGTHEDESRRFAPGIKDKCFHVLYLTTALVSLARLFGQGILNGVEWTSWFERRGPHLGNRPLQFWCNQNRWNLHCVRSWCHRLEPSTSESYFLHSSGSRLYGLVQFSIIDTRPLHGMSDVCERHDLKLLTYGTLVRRLNSLWVSRYWYRLHAVWRIFRRQMARGTRTGLIFRKSYTVPEKGK